MKVSAAKRANTPLSLGKILDGTRGKQGVAPVNARVSALHFFASVEHRDAPGGRNTRAQSLVCSPGRSIAGESYFKSADSRVVPCRPVGIGARPVSAGEGKFNAPLYSGPVDSRDCEGIRGMHQVWHSDM